MTLSQTETHSVSLLPSELQLGKNVEKPILLGLGHPATLVSFPKKCQRGFPVPFCWAGSQEAASHSCIMRCLCPVLRGVLKRTSLSSHSPTQWTCAAFIVTISCSPPRTLTFLRNLPAGWGSCHSARQRGHSGPCRARPP